MLGPGRLDSLAARLAVLLTIAILPLGLIAIVQTYRLIEESAAKTDAALYGEMFRSARAERELIQAAVGLAEGLAGGILRISDAECTQIAHDIVADPSSSLNFVGFVNTEGVVTCGNLGIGTDFSQSPDFADAIAEPRTIVEATSQGAITGEPIINIRAPAFRDGTLAGYVTMSLPHDAIFETSPSDSKLKPIELITFNAEGTVLTAGRLGLAEVEPLLPVNRALPALAGTSSVFRDVDATGTQRIYTVTPLIEGVVYAMAIWSTDIGITSLVQRLLLTIFLPIALWAASLGIAYFAVYRLVIRNIQLLRRRMRLFSRFRRVEEVETDAALPTELREVVESFVEMAHTILHDEAELENSLREKDVLLREVFHRVRNNLQLIASINAMQIRAAVSPETRLVLGRLQERIMALATIHQSLYEADSLSRIRADDLVANLARLAMEKARSGPVEITLETELAPITLYPDQAVPLSLLLVEAMSNAIKEIEATCRDDHTTLLVSMSQGADEMIELVIQNACLDHVPPSGNEGLGTRLIDAFVVQLDGTKEVTAADGAYHLAVRFRPATFHTEPEAASA